jgi:hypothetical protein
MKLYLSMLLDLKQNDDIYHSSHESSEFLMSHPENFLDLIRNNIIPIFILAHLNRKQVRVSLNDTI